LKQVQGVLFLESASKFDYGLHRGKNPVRQETWEEAATLDKITRDLWSGHRDFHLIPNERDFNLKISQAIKIVSRYL
jgi:hypothetical protein